MYHCKDVLFIISCTYMSHAGWHVTDIGGKLSQLWLKQLPWNKKRIYWKVFKWSAWPSNICLMRLGGHFLSLLSLLSRQFTENSENGLALIFMGLGRTELSWVKKKNSVSAGDWTRSIFLAYKHINHYVNKTLVYGNVERTLPLKELVYAEC